MDVMKKVPIKEQDPAVRAKNFEEVCLGYTKEEAVEEASRCLNCKNPLCVFQSLILSNALRKRILKAHIV